MKNLGSHKLFLAIFVIIGILGFQGCGDSKGGASLTPKAKTLKSVHDLTTEGETDSSLDPADETDTEEETDSTDTPNNNPPVVEQAPPYSGPPIAPGHEWYPETGMCTVTLSSRRGNSGPRFVANGDAVGKDSAAVKRIFKLRQKDLKQGRTFRMECVIRAQKFFDDYCAFTLGYEDSRNVHLTVDYKHMPQATCRTNPTQTLTVCGSSYTRHLVLSGMKARRNCSSNNQVPLPEFKSDAQFPD